MTEYRQHDVAYVFNPTNEGLSVKWDGEDYYFGAGYTAMPAFLAQKAAKEQEELGVLFLTTDQVVVVGKESIEELHEEVEAPEAPEVLDEGEVKAPKPRRGRPAKKTVTE